MSARRISALLILIFVVLGGFKFYHYNYVANRPGQARDLRLHGLRERVCNGMEYNKNLVDQCGTRSIYGDADWGITAYFTIYGIEKKEEAEQIVDFMRAAREQSGQSEIPINVEIYSTPRTAGPRPAASLIYHKKF